MLAIYYYTLKHLLIPLLLISRRNFKLNSIKFFVSPAKQINF